MRCTHNFTDNLTPSLTFAFCLPGGSDEVLMLERRMNGHDEGEGLGLGYANYQE